MDERMIPYFSHEGDMARMERVNKRMFILLLVMIIAFVGSNAFWIWRENQFTDEFISIEAEQETSDGGDNYVVGGDYNVETESESND